MKNFIFSGIFFFAFFGLFAQNDTLSVDQRIASMPLSPFERISKGRQLLSEEFEAGNMDEVRRIMNYLDTKVDDTGHLSLWNNERMMLYYWTKEYDKIILFSIQPKIGYSMQPIVYPPNDGLDRKIIDKTGENFNRLSEEISKKNFSEDTNSFLRLLLMRLLLDREERFVALEEVNKGAEDFIRDYPASPLCATVKEEILYTFVLSDWGFGMSFSGGYASTFGNIDDVFDIKGNFGININAYYKRFAFSFMIQPYFGKLLQDIPVNDTRWEKGEASNLVSFGLTAGYSILNNKRFRITPFAGIVLSTAGPEKDLEDDNPGLKDISLGPCFSGVFGVNTEIKLNDPLNIRSRNPGYLYSVSIRAGYSPGILHSSPDLYSGGMFFASIGFTLDYFRLKRRF